jgi:hypothetical protein
MQTFCTGHLFLQFKKGADLFVRAPNETLSVVVDVRQQSRSFALCDPGPRRSPNSNPPC